MDWLHDLLAHSALLRLFLVIAIGYLLGEIKLPGNFRFGIAAVLFVGLALGTWDPQFGVPEEIGNVGLVLFVYCVGLEVAPGFLRTFKRDGLFALFATLISLGAAATLTWGAIHWLEKPAALMWGAFCGSLTNTPALASVTDTLRQTGAAPGQASLAVVGYGITYPFAVVALLLLMHQSLRRQPSEGEAASGAAVWIPPAFIRVDSDKGWTVREIQQETGVILSRIYEPAGSHRLLEESDCLLPGARVVAIGSRESIAQATERLGTRLPEAPEMDGFEVHRYFLSNPAIAGRALGDLALKQIGAVVSRIRRGDVDLPVHPDTVMHLGDRVKVVSYPDTEAKVRRLFGNSLKLLGETGYLTFCIGIVLGLLVGMIPIHVPGLATPIKLGAAGGPLVAALLLGTVGRTGNFVWNLPYAANQTLKQFGLLLFLAAVGLKAGGSLVAALEQDGWFLAGFAIVTLLATHLTLWLLLAGRGEREPAVFCGQSSGLQTQPAALAFAMARAPGLTVTTAYATIFPIASIAKIVIAQLLMRL